jgi:hypothetical protein
VGLKDGREPVCSGLVEDDLVAGAVWSRVCVVSGRLGDRVLEPGRCGALIWVWLARWLTAFGSLQDFGFEPSYRPACAGGASG